MSVADNPMDSIFRALSETDESSSWPIPSMASLQWATSDSITGSSPLDCDILTITQASLESTQGSLLFFLLPLPHVNIDRCFPLFRNKSLYVPNYTSRYTVFIEKIDLSPWEPSFSTSSSIILVLYYVKELPQSRYRKVPPHLKDLLCSLQPVPPYVPRPRQTPICF